MTLDDLVAQYQDTGITVALNNLERETPIQAANLAVQMFHRLRVDDASEALSWLRVVRLRAESKRQPSG